MGHLTIALPFVWSLFLFSLGHPNITHTHTKAHILFSLPYDKQKRVNSSRHKTDKAKIRFWVSLFAHCLFHRIFSWNIASFWLKCVYFYTYSPTLFFVLYAWHNNGIVYQGLATTLTFSVGWDAAMREKARQCVYVHHSVSHKHYVYYWVFINLFFFTSVLKSIVSLLNDGTANKSDIYEKHTDTNLMPTSIF